LIFKGFGGLIWGKWVTSVKVRKNNFTPTLILPLKEGGDKKRVNPFLKGEVQFNISPGLPPIIRTLS